MILPYTIVNPLTTVRIPRRLPRQGEVIVGIGESVEPAQTVAQTTLSGEFRIIDVARELGVSPKKAKSFIKVKIGQRVLARAVLAERGGISRQRCRAPIDGRITGYGRGRLLLEAPEIPLQLSALVPGVIVDTWSNRGVLIETTGAFIQGIWGNGKESYGVLKMAVRNARRALRAKQIDASAQGTILVGGAQLDEEAIEQAIEMRVQGIIVGGIPPELLPKIEAVDFAVVVTEGVGVIPMSKAVFRLLRSMDGREVAISGLQEQRSGGERPFIIVPMPTESGNPIQPESPIVIGSRVRGMRWPYMGISGTVLELPSGRSLLETGARLPGATVKFDDKSVAFVPFFDLERLL
ncbi:MAG: hypothetical protein JW981_10645 [Anaerolineae bacterium]|nr:hypothetical protein [Anaerolineae bacterium]